MAYYVRHSSQLTLLSNELSEIVVYKAFDFFLDIQK